MRKIILILSFLLLFSCNSSKYNHVTIINNSESSIVCFLSEKDIIEMKGVFDMHSPSEIKKNDFAFIGSDTFQGSWTRFLENCNNKEARLYIIAKDSVDKYGWDKIYEKGIYNKKYLLTIEGLNKIDWEITYDGK